MWRMIGARWSARHRPIGSTCGTLGPISLLLVPGLLIVNPRSGDDSPTPEELAREARARGVEVRVLEPGDDPAEAARDADGPVGVAGGDGSLAPVAAVALERDLPFVCVPYGTRNHFARDVGLDRDDPLAALAAFEGVERRVDVGRVGERLFLNNVSLGLYAQLVHRRERHRRRREPFPRGSRSSRGRYASSSHARRTSIVVVKAISDGGGSSPRAKNRSSPTSSAG